MQSIAPQIQFETYSSCFLGVKVLYCEILTKLRKILKAKTNIHEKTNKNVFWVRKASFVTKLSRLDNGLPKMQFRQSRGKSR